MTIYLLRRLLLSLITLLMLTLVSFSLVYLPNLALFGEQWLLFDYFDYIGGLLNGNFGNSSISGDPILSQLKILLPATLELCILAIVLASILGTILGIIAGIYYHKWQDYTISTFALLGLSLPTFWLALLFVTLFSLYLDWLPISGRYDLQMPFKTVSGFMLIDVWLMDQPEKKAILLNLFKHMILPVITLSIAPITEIIRLLRASVIDVSQQNYIKAAASRNISKFTIIYRHILHNALPPIIPKLGLQFSTMLTLTMTVEIIFNWNGVGHWLMYSLRHQDFMAISSGVLVVGILVIIVNLLSDIVGVLANPLKHKELYVLR